MSRYADDLIQYIDRQWGNAVDVKSCARIIDFLERSPKQQVERITFLDLARVTGQDSKSEELLKAVSLLTSRFMILEMHLVFFNESGEARDLSDLEAAYFFETGSVVDPAKGVKIVDASHNVFPYFSATDSIESALKTRHEF